MDRPTLRPPFAYYGGKSTLASAIADLLPAHKHYVEPFAGGLSVLLAKPRSRAETVNDLDGDLVAFWRTLRDEPEELSRLCNLTPHSREEYAISKNLDVETDLERARRVWVRLSQGRSNSMKPTGWRYSTEPNRTAEPAVQLSRAGRIIPLAERLQGVTLENRDAIDVINDFGKHPDVLLYVDPPYVGSTRATNYRHELTGDDEHTVLAEALQGCRATVVLSGYDSELYSALFPTWHRSEMKGPPTLTGSQTDRVEVLWSNRPIGEPDLFGGVA